MLMERIERPAVAAAIPRPRTAATAVCGLAFLVVMTPVVLLYWAMFGIYCALVAATFSAARYFKLMLDMIFYAGSLVRAR